MGRRLLLSLMNENTRNSIHRIRRHIDNFTECKIVDIRLNEDGSVGSIQDTNIECTEGYHCVGLERFFWTIVFICLFLSVIGVVPILFYFNDRKNFQHVILQIHAHRNTPNHARQLSEYFYTYYDPPYSLDTIFVS